jgi:negative regulator of sigma E activity
MRTGRDADELLKLLSRAHRERDEVPLGPDFTARVMEAVRREAARADEAAGLWEGLAQWFTARFVLSLGGAAAAAAALAGVMLRGLESDILRLSLQGASAARYLTLGLQ